MICTWLYHKKPLLITPFFKKENCKTENSKRTRTWQGNVRNRLTTVQIFKKTHIKKCHGAFFKVIGKSQERGVLWTVDPKYYQNQPGQPNRLSLLKSHHRKSLLRVQAPASEPEKGCTGLAANYFCLFADCKKSRIFFSFLPHSNSLDLVLEPYKAFWVDKAPFKWH